MLSISLASDSHGIESGSIWKPNLLRRDVRMVPHGPDGKNCTCNLRKGDEGWEEENEIEVHLLSLAYLSRSSPPSLSFFFLLVILGGPPLPVLFLC